MGGGGWGWWWWWWGDGVRSECGCVPVWVPSLHCQGLAHPLGDHGPSLPNLKHHVARWSRYGSRGLGFMDDHAIASVRRRLASRSVSAGVPVRLRGQVAGSPFRSKTLRWATASESTLVSSFPEQCLLRCLDMMGFRADEATCLTKAVERVHRKHTTYVQPW